MEKYIYLNTKEKRKNLDSYKRQQQQTAKIANKARQQTVMGFYIFSFILINTNSNIS